MYGLLFLRNLEKALFFSLHILCINIEEEVTQKTYRTHNLWNLLKYVVSHSNVFFPILFGEHWKVILPAMNSYLL